MKSNKSSIRIVALTLIFTLVLSFTGCSDLINGFYAGRTKSFVNDFIEAASENFTGALTEFSEEEIVQPDLIDEQQELLDLALSKLAFGEVTCKNADKKGATIELSLTYVDINSNYSGLFVGNIDDLTSAVKKVKAKPVSFELEITNNNGEMTFADLTSLREAVISPFEKFCILDDDGNPLNITDAYMQYIYLDNIWYDSFTANPSNSTSLSNQKALIDVFYFTKPVTAEMQAILYRNGDQVGEISVVMDNEVTAYCEFGQSVIGASAQSGSYTVELYYNDILIDTSDSISVS